MMLIFSYRDGKTLFDEYNVANSCAINLIMEILFLKMVKESWNENFDVKTDIDLNHKVDDDTRIKAKTAFSRKGHEHTDIDVDHQRNKNTHIKFKTSYSKKSHGQTEVEVDHITDDNSTHWNVNANFGEKGRNTAKVNYEHNINKKQNVSVKCEVGAKNSVNVGYNGFDVDVTNLINSAIDSLFEKKFYIMLNELLI